MKITPSNAVCSQAFKQTTVTPRTSNDHVQTEFTDYQQKQFVTRYYHRYVHNMVEARAKMRTNKSDTYKQDTVVEISVALYLKLLAMLDFVQLKFQENVVATTHLKIHCIDGGSQRASNATLINNVLRDAQSGNLFGFIGPNQVFSDVINDMNYHKECVDFKKRNACILMPCLRLHDHLMIKELECGFYLVNYFQHCTFGCGRKNGDRMFIIKQNGKVAKKLEKCTTRNNDIVNNNRKYEKKHNLNSNFGIDLFIYQLTVQRLSNKEKINIIRDLQFCYQFINDEVIVIPDKYFNFIHFMIDKHDLQCPLNGFFCMILPKNKTNNIKNDCYCNNVIEIYRVRICNPRYGYSYLMTKYSNQIIISDKWKRYYDKMVNKMQILNKLGKLNVNILKSIDKRSRDVQNVGKEIYWFHQKSINHDKILLCKLYTYYGIYKIQLNQLFTNPYVESMDPMNVAATGCNQYYEKQLIYNNGSTITATGRANDENRVWKRLPDNIVIGIASTGYHSNLTLFPNYFDRDGIGKIMGVGSVTLDAGTGITMTLFGYFWTKYPDSNWVYQRKDDDVRGRVIVGVRSKDGMHFLPKKYFDSRYRNLNCHFCGQRRRKRMLVCKKCRSVRYCNRKCQKQGWKLKKHRNECHTLFSMYVRFRIGHQRVE